MAINKKIKSNLAVPATLSQIKTWSYIFKVLGDNCRLNILKEIIDNPGISGKEMIVNLKLTQPTLSFHLKQLHKAGIIHFKKDGQTHCYFINNESITLYYERVKEACDLIYKRVVAKKSIK